MGFEYNKRVTRLERTIVRADYRKSRILEDKQIEGECENIDPFPSLADIFIPGVIGRFYRATMCSESNKNPPPDRNNTDRHERGIETKL